MRTKTLKIIQAKCVYVYQCIYIAEQKKNIQIFVDC